MSSNSGKRMTYAERQALQVQQEAEREALFASEREGAWAEIWPKVLYLFAAVTQNPALGRSANWWFYAFELDVRKETFRCDGLKAHVSKHTLSRLQYGYAKRSLETGLRLTQRFFEEEERRYQEALRLNDLRQSALAKLTAEEIEALGL